MFTANTLKDTGKLFYTCPFHKEYLKEKLTSEIVARHSKHSLPLLFLISPFM